MSSHKHNLVKKCLICKSLTANDTLHWHKDPDTEEIWVWCQGKCKRGYSIYEYCYQAGLSVKELLDLGLNFIEAPEAEVSAMEWSRHFLHLGDQRAKLGLDYLRSRGLRPASDMYYDSSREGIVFAYYYENTFVGAQIRFLVDKVTEDGDPWKITTLPGTRLGYLFWGWSQNPLSSSVKYLVLTEGAFNAASIQQSLNDHYGNLLQNPYRCIATSGSGISKYHIDQLKTLIDNGMKIIASPDSDEAGLKMLNKIQLNGACTHYSLVSKDGVDWNDLLKHNDEKFVAQEFLSQITRS